MRTHIQRRMIITAATFGFAAGSIFFSTGQLYADVKITRANGEVQAEPFVTVDIYNTISKSDAQEISKYRSELEYGGLNVSLDSPGGDVDAAMQIGRLIRQSEGATFVPKSKKCYSSCALIYISGVIRNNNGGHWIASSFSCFGTTEP